MQSKLSKAHDSDDRSDSEEETQSSSQHVDKKDRPLTDYQVKKNELADTPAIPDSECSPAAFIFAQTDEEKQQIVFEEQ